MKRILQTVCVALATVSCILAVSCSKEQQPAKENNTISIKLKGEIGDFQGETKGSIVNSVRIGWSANDAVYVYQGASYLGVLYAPATIEDNRVAELSGTITAPSTTPATLTFIASNTFSGNPEVEYSKITVDLREQGDEIPYVIYGKAEISSTSVSNLVIPFKFATSAVKVSATDLEPGVAISKSKLFGVNTKCILTLGAEGAVTVEGSIGALPGVVSDVIVKTETAKSASASGYAFFEFGVPISGANADRFVAAFQNSIHSGKALPSAIEASKYVNSIAKLKAGVFSVASGTKVVFSRGNLQATYSTATSSYTWGFAENQYEGVDGKPHIAKTTGNNTIDSQTDGAKVDLFGWVGASSGYTGNQAYGISTSTTDSHYGNVNNEALKADWGTTIDNKGTWRTLTFSEWKYLLGTDATRNGLVKRLGIKLPTGVSLASGLFIYPDGWPTDQIPSNTQPFYYLPDWLAAEAKGVVFLPDTGNREGSDVNSDSGYWSSTSGTGLVYAVTSTSLPFTIETKARYKGFSVRLVTSAQ